MIVLSSSVVVVCVTRGAPGTRKVRFGIIVNESIDIYKQKDGNIFELSTLK